MSYLGKYGLLVNKTRQGDDFRAISSSDSNIYVDLASRNLEERRRCGFCTTPCLPTPLFRQSFYYMEPVVPLIALLTRATCSLGFDRPVLMTTGLIILPRVPRGISQAPAVSPAAAFCQYLKRERSLPTAILPSIIRHDGHPVTTY